LNNVNSNKVCQNKDMRLQYLEEIRISETKWTNKGDNLNK